LVSFSIDGCDETRSELPVHIFSWVLSLSGEAVVKIDDFAETYDKF